MSHRTLALFTLLAAFTIAAFFLHERERETPAEAGQPAARAEAAPSAELVAGPLGRVEVRPPEPSTRSEIPVHARAGEKTALLLPVPEAADVVLVFHARDVSGQPVLGELSVSIRTVWRGNAGSVGTRASTTNGAGRFEVRIEPALLDADRRELEVSTRDRTLMARVDLGRAFPPGETDMGDLVLVPAPLIAEGRVIDTAGRPLAEATIVAFSTDRRSFRSTYPSSRSWWSKTARASNGSSSS
jgi:hypothetical protein